MKRTILLAAVALASAALMAEGIHFGWMAPCLNSDDARKAQSQVYALKRDAAGAAYVLINIGSHGDSLSSEPQHLMEPTTFLGQEYYGARYRGTGYNNNLALVKFSAAGRHEWSVWSDQGDMDLSASAMVPAADGSVMLAISARHTDTVAGLDTRLLRLHTTASGDTLTFSLPFHYPTGSTKGPLRLYHSVLVSIAPDGSLTAPILPVVHPDQGDASVKTSDRPWKFIDLQTDGSNFYLIGQVSRTTTIGNLTINPAAEGQSLFVAKFDREWNGLNCITTTGAEAGSTLTAATFSDGRLYLATTAKAVKGATLRLGEASCLMSDTTNSIYFTRLDTALHADYLTELPGQESGGRNSIQVKSLCVIDGRAYVSGSVQGTLVCGSTVPANSSGFYQSFLASCSAADGSWLSVVIAAKKGINQYSALLPFEGDILAYGYDFGGNPYTHGVEVYSTDLELKNTWALTTKGGMSISGPAVLVGDTLITAGRYFNNQKPILTYAPAEANFTATTNSAFVCAHILNNDASALREAAVLPQVAATRGQLTARHPAGGPLKVFTPAGLLIASGHDTLRLSLPAGLYLVSAGSRVVKVVVP